MLDYGFQNYEAVTLGDFAADIPVVSGVKEIVRCTTVENISVLLPKSHGEIETRVEMYPFVYAPVIQGESLGRIVYICDGKEIGEIEIAAAESVELSKQKYTVWDRIFDKNKD